MQATHPVRIANAGRAAFAAIAAIVLAAAIVAGVLVASGAFASLGGGTDTNAGAGGQAPLVLDPDARNGGGWKQPGPHRAE